MNNEIKEIYLSNLEWTKTHDNIGGVMGNLIFKDNMSYEEYEKLLKSSYFALCNKDYIINLQQENKYLNNELNNMTDYAKDLQQENEYLKKQNDDKTRIGVADHKYASQMEDKVILLQQENERLKEIINKLENYIQKGINNSKIFPTAEMAYQLILDKLKELEKENE